MNLSRRVAILLALVRKEAGGAFRDPVILFGAAFLSLLGGVAFALGVVGGDDAATVFDSVVLFMLFLSILLFPVVSMRTFSDDNSAGNLETLLTAPISPFAAVLAKYAGAMAFVLLYAAQGALYAWLLSLGGSLDPNAVLSALLALFAFGSFAISLGVLVSALASSSVGAAAGTGGMLLFLSLLEGLDPSSGMLRSLSFLPHAKRWIAGKPDIPGLLHFASATALFLFYAWLAVNSRESRRAAPNAVVRRRVTATGVLAASGIVLLLVQASVLHINGFWRFWENDTPLGTDLSRIDRIVFAPLLFAVAAFVWSALTWRAARRAHRNGKGTRVQRYATMTESQVMKAPRYYYEENRRARRRVVLAATAALAAAVCLNGLADAGVRAKGENPLVAELRVRRIFPSTDSLVAGATGRPGKTGDENPDRADRRMKFTASRLRAVLWTGLVWMPLAWALAGAAMWWVGRE